MKGSKPSLSNVQLFAYNLPLAKIVEHFKESLMMIWLYIDFTPSATDPIPQEASKKTRFLWSRLWFWRSALIESVNVSLLPKYLINNICTNYTISLYFEIFIVANISKGKGTAVLSSSLLRTSTGRELFPIFTQSSLKLGGLQVCKRPKVERVSMYTYPGSLAIW